ncbi:MAG: hypothetical protein AAF230_10245 [Pseudomonadota bacterium]
MSADEKTLTIVYQFGKVASTSLVNTLRLVDGLDVHQSHFLGEHALQRIVPIAVSQSTNGYFHEHLRGQLLTNVDLTYRMNRVLAGHGAHRLKVLSLSREPLDWLRSGLLQDIDGYRSDLLAFAARAGVEGEAEDVVLQQALVLALRQIAELIDELGGMFATTDDFLARGGKAMMAPFGPELEMIVRKLFFLALRPHVWFEEHFRPCFGIGLEDFTSRDGLWVLHQPRADFAILRYEDLDEMIEDAFAALELGPVGPLVRSNVSKSKPLAETVTQAFASDEAEALSDRLVGSRYAAFFGYAQAPAQPGVAAE